jgi:hypothetical protein
MNKKYLKIPGGILLGALAVFVFGSLVMLLWNEVATAVFHLPVISFWQAVGLMILSRLLFGGLGHSVAHKAMRRKDYTIWHKRFEEKMANMTPEEKEKFWESRSRYFHAHFSKDFEDNCCGFESKKDKNDEEK